MPLSTDSVQRTLTIAHDSAAFPSKSALVHVDGTLWWDLDYLRLDMYASGDTQHKYHWLRIVKKRIVNIAGLSADCVHLVSRSVYEGIGNAVFRPVCTTLALLHYINICCSSSRIGTVVQRCVGLQRNMVARALCMLKDDTSLTFCAGMRVTSQAVYGFRHAVCSRQDYNTSTAIQLWWQRMVQSGELAHNFDADTHWTPIFDILHCVTVLPKFRAPLRLAWRGPVQGFC